MSSTEFIKGGRLGKAFLDLKIVLQVCTSVSSAILFMF